jgi:hypothetical protein
MLYHPLPRYASHGRVAYQYTNLLGGQPRLACTTLCCGATRGAWIHRGLFDFRLGLPFARDPIHPCFLIYSRLTGFVAVELGSYSYVRPPDWRLKAKCTHQKITTRGGAFSICCILEYTAGAHRSSQACVSNPCRSRTSASFYLATGHGGQRRHPFQTTISSALVTYS